VQNHLIFTSSGETHHFFSGDLNGVSFEDDFSIGSNDLTQLTVGLDRDSGDLGRWEPYGWREPQWMDKRLHKTAVPRGMRRVDGCTICSEFDMELKRPKRKKIGKSPHGAGHQLRVAEPRLGSSVIEPSGFLPRGNQLVPPQKEI